MARKRYQRGHVLLQGDVWYVADVFGERVPGTALLTNFDQALAMLADWRSDPNRWIRRAVGAGIHHWAKRSRGTRRQPRQAKRILHFLVPTLQERNTDAIKGIGWGLKTIGRFQPNLMVDWLGKNRRRPGVKISRLMLRKAVTYLDRTQRARALGTGL